MQEIRGDAKSVRTLLSGRKYSVDYYQREYRWETKQVTELLEDLADKFLESHEAENDRAEVQHYGHYFLGSIIVSDKDNHQYIIDGQQRLTTLTLLLIYLYRQITDSEQKTPLVELVFSQKYGKRSFNLDISDRTDCMEALFLGQAFDESGQSESVLNILHRYQDIEEHFPDDLSGETLPYFTDWLIENVHLVEITAYSDADAYTIFETMNDRGLSLSPTEMLKGYLLNHIEDPTLRIKAGQTWKNHIAHLQSLGKEEDADGIKAWLRSQYAQTIRERKRGAQPRDFDRIGTEFHRWVRDNEKALDIKTSTDYARFIQEDFSFYAFWYEHLRKAAETLTQGLEAVYYNNQSNFTLQYPLLLAPLTREDKEPTIIRKLRIVATFVDILIARRVWNVHAIDYSTMQYSMFRTMTDIRGQSPIQLAATLTARLSSEETFENNEHFHLHGTNGKQVHRLLARMTDFVETHAGRASRYHEYIQRGGKGGYEIEHIWANHPEHHRDEFAHPADFADYRNHIGGLLLLPKSFNASYGDLPYSSKREHYYSQNLLAQSLHEKAYDHDPGFLKFVRDSRLSFQPHPHFKKVDLDERQRLYRQLAEKVWDPSRLMGEAEG